MGCGSCCMKTILHIANLLLTLSGVVLILAGVFILMSTNVVQAYVLIVMGSINVLAALIGCCGICFENVCLTATYAIFILISLIGQIYNMVQSESSETVTGVLRKGVLELWNKEVQTPGAMDSVQDRYKCCGLQSAKDYINIGRLIPTSCYRHKTSELLDLFKDGCETAMINSYQYFAKYQQPGEWVSLTITIILGIFATYLVYRFNTKDRYRY